MVEKLKNPFLESLYTVNNPVEVLNYLSTKPHLTSFLGIASQKIREVFTKEKLIIKMLFDPEIINWKKLIISIHTSLDADEAYDKLKILDNSWWIDASSLVGNNLDIHIEFDEV